MTKPIAISFGLLLLLFGLAFAKVGHPNEGQPGSSELTSLSR